MVFDLTCRFSERKQTYKCETKRLMYSCLYFQEKTSNSTSGFVVTDFIMPARDKPVSHSPSDPPLCENVSFIAY